MTDENITLLAAGIEPGSRFAEIVAERADIMALTQATHEAILNPRVAGGITYGERAAFACRIARLNGEKTLAAHYEKLIQQASEEAEDDDTYGAAKESCYQEKDQWNQKNTKPLKVRLFRISWSCAIV